MAVLARFPLANYYVAYLEAAVAPCFNNTIQTQDAAQKWTLRKFVANLSQRKAQVYGSRDRYGERGVLGLAGVRPRGKSIFVRSFQARLIEEVEPRPTITHTQKLPALRGHGHEWDVGSQPSQGGRRTGRGKIKRTSLSQSTKQNASTGVSQPNTLIARTWAIQSDVEMAWAFKHDGIGRLTVHGRMIDVVFLECRKTRASCGTTPLKRFKVISAALDSQRQNVDAMNYEAEKKSKALARLAAFGIVATQRTGRLYVGKWIGSYSYIDEIAVLQVASRFEDWEIVGRLEAALHPWHLIRDCANEDEEGLMVL
ncbi:hypothetical protein BC832DRAFT_610330 [Gaertneriomyces semiglobifer]|nr:hypothetical protein BC832DRAFT_610330 [Gaertneriomyces semiglobifer]